MNAALRRPRVAKVLSIVLMAALLTGCSAVPTSAPTQPYPASTAAGATSTIGAPYPPGGPSATIAPPTPLSTPNLSATAPQTNNTATPSAVQVAQLPQPNSANWMEWVGGLTRPTDIAFLPNLPQTAYILQQDGVIAVAENGSLRSQPLMDLTGKAMHAGNEQGLLGIALDPHFADNRYFYTNYTDGQGNTVISRFQAGADFLTADPGSQKILLHVDQPFANHNGGGLAFGPDGYLYIGLGDGGSQGDPHGNGQSLDTYLGKILRIDMSGDPYSIPAGNPFANGGGKLEIWAYGLRNPWRFSFDRLTGDLYIADVGQDTWEEVDFQAAGAAGGIDYGWNFREGLHPYKGTPPLGAVLTDPVVNYSHAEGGCSITGGFVYRGQALPTWQGVYLYGDYCTGNIWGLAKISGTWQSVKLFATSYNISSFGQDTNGELYVLDLSGGGVYKLVPNS